MLISLHLVKLEQLRSLSAGSTQVDGFRMAEGALPAAYLIKSAIANLRAGFEAIWHSFFLFIDDEGRNAIGSGNFHGPPSRGRVEIGYEVAPSYRGSGVATQAAKLLVEQAFAHSTVKEVVAHTTLDNFASRRVVEKAGFELIGQRQVEGFGLTDEWLIRKT